MAKYNFIENVHSKSLLITNNEIEIDDDEEDEDEIESKDSYRTLFMLKENIS